MKRNYLIFAVILLIAVLTLSGCGREEQSLEGLYIATFELQGGTLETPTSSVGTKINFAYHPGTYVLDPTELNGYKLFRNGFVFTGWYTDASCTPSSKWDFKTLLNQEALTLYAGWKKAVTLSYTLYYTADDGQLVSLGKYEVSSGDKFDDWRNYAKGRPDYTPIGYYADPECTQPWDAETTHPGQEEDLDVPVYVDYMKGRWTFVDSFSALKSAVLSNENVHLTADIDCAGETLAFTDYSGEINGNGHVVSNFSVKKKGTAIVSCSIFNSLGDGAVIRDITFSGVTYDVTGVTGNVTKIKVAALAVKAGNVTVSSVRVEGTITTDYTGELLASEIPMYYETTTDSAVVTVSESSVNVVIAVN
jgi:uncharacterized repeat protein (TIGR02543 family)